MRAEPKAVCDGGDLDCGSGLLLIIRKAMAPLAAGDVLEVRSREGSVREDLPAWCRLVGHTLVGTEPGEARATRYFVAKKGEDGDLDAHLARARDHEWRVRAVWREGMSATAFFRNHALVVGQPASFDTADAAPAAVEMLLSALAGCLAVGFAWRASRRGVELRALEISLGARADNVLVFLGVEEEGHPGLAAVKGRVYVDADASDDELEALWRETLRGSPAAQTVLRGAPVSVEWSRA